MNMRLAHFALASFVSVGLASAASAQVVNLGPINGNAESITNFSPNDWFVGGSNGGFVNATPNGGKNGTGGFGIGSGSSLPAVGSADLRSKTFSVADATANTGKVDFSFDYNLLRDFPAAGFPLGDMRVQLRFFSNEAGTQFVGESNTNIGTNNGATPGTWQSVLVDDFTVPAGATHADIRVSVNVFESGNIISANLDNFAVTTVVPEPASLSLLGLGSMALLRRRRA
jgi:hypothetical protein